MTEKTMGELLAIKHSNEMTLRDWFAGQALISLVPLEDITLEETALAAYRYADAMMEARKK